MVEISANQLEAGDTQVASLVGVLEANITANQLEAGDTQIVAIEVLVIMAANQLEAGATISYPFQSCNPAALVVSA